MDSGTPQGNGPGSEQASTATDTHPHAPVGRLDRYFRITQRGSTISREVMGGLVTFATMAYILALNPIIIGQAADVNGKLISGAPKLDAAGHIIAANVGASMAMVAAATALIAGLMTILMGVYGKFPLALATGLGLNALLAYVVAPTMTWPQAMGLIVWEGLIITILVLTGFRRAVFRAVPPTLRSAIAVGIGLFIAFIGLIDGGIVRKPEGSSVPVELGIHGSLAGWPTLVFVVGLVAVAVLYAKKVKGALLIGIAAATALAILLEVLFHPGSVMKNPTGWMLNTPALPTSFPLPDLGLLGRVDMFGAFHTNGHFNAAATLGAALIIFSLLLTDFFDTMGTVVAIGAEAKLLDADGNPPRTQQILLVDSLAAAAGGLGSVSSNTSYIESAAGVGAGARTGLASVVTGAAFLVSMFAAPLVNMIPSEASTPVLVFVGFLMMSQVVRVDWNEIDEAFPAFLTIVLMPFTFSITAGIGAGFIFYIVFKILRKKAREVHPLLYVVAALFVIWFTQGMIAGIIKG